MEVQNQLLKDENKIFKAEIKTISDLSNNCAREMVEMKQSTDTNPQTHSLKHTKPKKSGQINQEMLSNINKRIQLKPGNFCSQLDVKMIPLIIPQKHINH